MHSSSRRSPRPLTVPKIATTASDPTEQSEGNIVQQRSLSPPPLVPSTTAVGSSSSSTPLLKDLAVERVVAQTAYLQQKVEGKFNATHQAGDAATSILPWWKRVLVDREYRKRLTDLSSQYYRDELRLLELEPFRVTSKAGMDPKSLTVMSQYIQLPIPETLQRQYRQGGLSLAELLEQLCATRHPASVIQCSALSSIRRLLFAQFPPTLSTEEQLQQVQEVEGYLSRKRRASLELSTWQKSVNKKDIMDGNIQLPDLVRGGGPPQSTEELPEDYNLNSEYLSSRQTVGNSSLRQQKRSAGGEPFAFVPPGKRLTEAEKRQRHQNLLEQNAAFLLDLSSTDGPRESQGAALSSPVVREDRGYEKKQEVYKDRLKEAIDSLEDGIENFYGLSYVWPTTDSCTEEGKDSPAPSSPLVSFPPNGYIRVLPDARYAMWPLTENDDKERIESRKKYTKERQERLTHHVNDVTRKVQLLRDYGLSVDYNDFVGEKSYFRNKFNQREKEEEKTALHHTPGEGKVGATKGLRRGEKAGMVDPFALGEARAPTPLTPLYDGAHYINFIALLPTEWLHREVGSPMISNVGIEVEEEENSKGTGKRSLASATSTAKTTHSSVTPVNFGCYRQSLLLLHYKIYCRAIHEEWRCRRDGGLARVVGTQLTMPKTHSAKEIQTIKEEEAAQQKLAEDRYYRSQVPSVSFPVLQVQSRSPPLRDDRRRWTVDLTKVSPPSSTTGLFPPPPADPASKGYRNFHHLHRNSAVARQALLDIFHSFQKQDEDGKEGASLSIHDRIGKETYVNFVLDLLHMFFPTLLVSVHLDIAEEEWVYRGTTELVSFDVFFEKFFSFPFVFYRDYSTITEEEYAEFWSIVYVCLIGNPQLATTTKMMTMSTTDGQRGADRKLSLLAPLSGFTEEQLLTLYRTNFHHDQREIHFQQQVDQTQREQSQGACDVKRLPKEQQKAIAHTVVRRKMDQEDRKERFQQRMNANGSKDAEKAPRDMFTTPDDVDDATEEGEEKEGERRHRVEVVQEEKERRDRLLKEVERELQLRRLLGTSELYQGKEQRRQARHHQAISQVESTTSTWELHKETVYHVPEDGQKEVYYNVVPEDHNTNPEEAIRRQREATARINQRLKEPRNKNYIPTKEEDEIIAYLKDAPEEVFTGNVSLRERFLTYKGYEAEREALKEKLTQYHPNQRRHQEGPDLLEQLTTVPTEEDRRTEDTANLSRCSDPSRPSHASDYYVSFAEGTFPIEPHRADKNDIETFTSQSSQVQLKEYYRKQQKRTSSSSSSSSSLSPKPEEGTPGKVVNEHIPRSRPATRTGVVTPSRGGDRLGGTTPTRTLPSPPLTELIQPNDGEKLTEKDLQNRLVTFHRRQKEFDTIVSTTQKKK